MDFERTDLENIIRHSTVRILPELYAIVKSTQMPEKEVFCVAKDSDEVTIIINEDRLDEIDYEDVRKGYKLFEIRVVLPFLALGFLAKITNTVAQQNQNVLVVSTFSKDYILIKEEGVGSVTKALSEVGFIIL